MFSSIQYIKYLDRSSFYIYTEPGLIRSNISFFMAKSKSSAALQWQKARRSIIVEDARDNILISFSGVSSPLVCHNLTMSHNKVRSVITKIRRGLSQYHRISPDSRQARHRAKLKINLWSTLPPLGDRQQPHHRPHYTIFLYRRTCPYLPSVAYPDRLEWNILYLDRYLMYLFEVAGRTWGGQRDFT